MVWHRRINQFSQWLAHLVRRWAPDPPDVWAPFPALHGMLAGSLHVDFDLDFGDWRDAVAAWACHSPAHEIGTVIAELDRFMALGLDGKTISRALMRASGTCVPDEHEATDWLLELREILSTAREAERP